MVEYGRSGLDDTFYALSHPARRGILQRLTEGSYRVTELAEPFDMSLNGVSKHLKVLERAGLVKRSREGRVHRMRFDPAPLREASKAIEFYRKFWEGQLESLSRYFEETQNPKTQDEIEP